MFKSHLKRYNIFVIIIFVLGETLFFDSNSPLQVFFTLFYYFIILFFLFFDPRVAFLYYFTFSLLSLNMGNYIFVDSLPPSFYGLRLFGFSFNVLFTFLLTGVCIILYPPGNILRVFRRPPYRFISFFILYSSILGLIMLGLNENYSDNYLKDLMTYIPFFFYVIFFTKLEDKDLILLIKYLIIGTFLLLIFSLVFGKYRQYVLGENILLSNTFEATFLIVIFFAKSLFNKILYYSMLIIYFILLSTGIIVVGGKSFIFLLILFFWYVLKKRKLFSILLVSLFLFFGKWVLDFLIIYFEGNIIASKLTQVSILFSFLDLKFLASMQNSLGNIVGELLTIIDYAKNNLLFFLLGKGFGGGLPDNLGYLDWWAGNSGYSEIDKLRNSYHKFHITVYEIFIKSGILFFIVYVKIVYKVFFSRNHWGLPYVILFLLMFSVSKEFILLTLLFENTYERIKLHKST